MGEFNQNTIEGHITLAKAYRKKIAGGGKSGTRVSSDDRALAELALDHYLAAYRMAAEEYSLDSETYAIFSRSNCAGLCACYRNVDEPEKALLLLQCYGGEDSPYLSASFFVSLASACCDLYDTESAKHYLAVAERRYNGSTDHIVNVQRRIKSIEAELSELVDKKDI